MSDLTAIGLELAVMVTALAVLLLDLWTPPEQKRQLGYVAAIAVGVIFVASFAVLIPEPRMAFGGMYRLDELSLYFKRFFLLTALVVLLMSIEIADRIEAGFPEYCALHLFALTGMMLAASAYHFAMVFVALELIAVTFYILTSYQRRRLASLEAGVKYLVLSAVASAFLVYGIALVFGASGTLDFARLADRSNTGSHRMLELGLLLVFLGLTFKLASVPFQFWAPDVYQGAPTPTVAFLALGSKAAGVALLIRVFHEAAPAIGRGWHGLFAGVSAATMLYGVLCAIPQRNLKRLLGYSSIANGGLVFMGLSTFSAPGLSAVLYFLAAYLFTLGAAFFVLCLVAPTAEDADIPALTGLHRRSPLLAAALALSMVSLAGIPPLAGFFGKFLLIKAALENGPSWPAMYALASVALLTAVISISYYFGVIRAIYWPGETEREVVRDPEPIVLSGLTRAVLWFCIVGMLWLGIAPDKMLILAEHAVRALAL
ncbi:MAG: NADH-quinone oxidoreductase subunit N [Verrucomicrobia bacterium]|jgi:NADH-quinone oxidoreductase subunit N|nr:NADH-quinone oxidoreductase subunit N [Verrucomicrobiota bacterium]OQC67016.1 MAG: NADH-quinone oxidoreductase subunit N [Verrucomicrobia bacterium ADurb.Bin006]MDI9382286.1 NADH-quinone oxidoreductase subunit N [Verrucomicrobiota bacterium]NMD20147.1 NADH-quinone oxidoreductase subunit N [Verrucomicrobiota bacterium]HOA60543.1 NADH-quinone oxidoreductase subunit N [Verrucomicrobiota bacterium]